jgi:hypothetical protein
MGTIDNAGLFDGPGQRRDLRGPSPTGRPARGTDVVNGWARSHYPLMPNFSTSPFWNRKLRLAILTLATFIALC